MTPVVNSPCRTEQVFTIAVKVGAPGEYFVLNYFISFRNVENVK
jgi:hypothetical protein